MKHAAAYYVRNAATSILITFGVLVGVFLVIGILVNIDAARVEVTVGGTATIKDNGVFSGFDMAYAVFVFVWSLCAFRVQFRFFQQNGISRKSQFAAWGITAAAMSLFLAVLSVAITYGMNQFFNYRSIFQQMYAPLFASGAGASLVFQEMLWNAALFLGEAGAGFAITLLYYRMGKTTKVLVSVLVPASLLLGLPAIDGLVQGALTRFFGWVGPQMFGFFDSGINILAPVGVFLAVALIAAGLAWGMMRRVPVKA